MSNLITALSADPLAMIARSVRNLLTHFLHCTGNFVGHLLDFQVLNKVLDLSGHAVTARDGFAEGDGFADDLQVRTASSTELQFVRRLRSALRTKHGWEI